MSIAGRCKIIWKSNWENLEMTLYGNDGVPQDQSWGPIINDKNDEVKSICILQVVNIRQSSLNSTLVDKKKTQNYFDMEEVLVEKQIAGY